MSDDAKSKHMGVASYVIKRGQENSLDCHTWKQASTKYVWFWLFF